jgi:quaternary ammonium compound-resistance protein SugE
MAWIYLLIASAAEIVWASSLKASEGYTKLPLVALNLVALALAVFFLMQAMRVLPLGTSYAVWTGIGIAGSALIGIFFLGESIAPTRLIAIGTIIAGVVMLRLVDG